VPTVELGNASSEGRIEPDGAPDGGLRGRVVRGAALATAGYLASQVISLLSFLVLARLAAPTIFGEYAAASVLLGVTFFFTEGGMQSAVIQRSDRVPEAASTAFVANIVGGCALTVLAAACAPLIGLFFHNRRIGLAAAVLAGIILINAASFVPGALLRRRISFLFAWIEPAAALAYGVVTIAALAAGLGLWGFVLGSYVNAFVRTVVTCALARWRPSATLISWGMLRSLSTYGRPIVLSSFLREIGTAGGTAIVGRLLGTGDLGLFRSAQRFISQANTGVIYGSGYALLPAFARIWQDERRFQESILRALRTLTLIVFPVSLAFIPLGRPIATVLLGERWRGAGPIMMAMAGIGVALAFDSISIEAFKATRRTDLLPRLHGLAAIVPLPLMVALQRFGAPGMGLAMSIGTGLVAMFAVRALGRVARIPVRTILVQARPALSSAGLMVGGVYALDRYVVQAGNSGGWHGLALLLLDLLAAAFFYVVALSVLSRGSMLELIDIAKLVLARVERSASSAARLVP
jgi:PST family polysaccharide transporter